MAEFDLLTNQTTYKTIVEKFLPIIFQNTGFQIDVLWVPCLPRVSMSNASFWYLVSVYFFIQSSYSIVSHSLCLLHSLTTGCKSVLTPCSSLTSHPVTPPEDTARHRSWPIRHMETLACSRCRKPLGNTQITTLCQHRIFNLRIFPRRIIHWPLPAKPVSEYLANLAKACALCDDFYSYDGRRHLLGMMASGTFLIWLSFLYTEQ